MKEFNGSTKMGQKLVKMGSTCCRMFLSDIYGHWSSAKEKAYNWCYDQYLKDNKSFAFGIGNASNFGFTASWIFEKDGEEVMRIETKDNSYLVWLDR